MRRITHPIASTVTAVSVLLLSVAFTARGIEEGPTFCGFFYALTTIVCAAGLLPIYLRATIQEWQEYMRGEDE